MLRGDAKMLVVRTTVRLDDDLYREVKARAAREGRTVASVLEDAVRVGMRRPADARREAVRQRALRARRADARRRSVEQRSVERPPRCRHAARKAALTCSASTSMCWCQRNERISPTTNGTVNFSRRGPTARSRSACPTWSSPAFSESSRIGESSPNRRQRPRPGATSIASSMHPPLCSCGHPNVTGRTSGASRTTSMREDRTSPTRTWRPTPLDNNATFISADRGFARFSRLTLAPPARRLIVEPSQPADGDRSVTACQ